MYPQLTIDYGAVATRAVLIWPGGWAPLTFAGQVELSSAVHLGDGPIVVGAPAWQHAERDPDGFVVSPLHADLGEVEVRGAPVDIADLVVATLRQVRAEAAQAAGRPVADVRLVVPAGWGPRRRTWLRHTCSTAGLPVTRMIDIPVAVAEAATPVGSPPPMGTTALVVDVGSGCEATVVSYGPAGWEVLSTLVDPDAGGDAIDAALTAALLADQLEPLTTGQRWSLLAAIRAAKQSLSGQPAVTVTLPGRAAAVVTTALLRQASEPAFEQAAALAATAVSNADLSLVQVSAVHVIGATAATPGAGDMIAVKLGRPVQVAQYPGIAAAVGAGEPSMPAGLGPEPVTLPPLRRLLGLTLPGVAALLLYAHFLLSADANNGTPQRPRPGYYVLAAWGELTTTCVLICVTALQAAGLLAALLAHRAPVLGRPGVPPSQIAGGLLAAAAISTAAAGLLAVTAAELFAQPMSTLMRWALLPILPLLATAITLAALSRRLPQPPAGGWDRVLTFPASSVITSAVGIAAVALWWQGPLPATLNGWGAALGTAGGLLTGIAIACALLRHPAGRIMLAVPAGFFTLILSRSGPDTIAVLYALAVAACYGMRSWTLYHRPEPPGAYAVQT
ncbi:Hsp70 family protein [Actinoplanes sp. M2I2]|uniref:Hsp70 family protein n=1 Tax=Actinoplanes sp. M2I2 TaxID=1734444 RepID=UPI00202186A1|nr:Hsp70 family protein [Actinoplanes sp. M2I2]